MYTMSLQKDYEELLTKEKTEKYELKKQIIMNLNELRDRAYKTACDKGFHDVELSNEHWLMLVITELSEAVEADRKGKRANVSAFKAREEDVDEFNFEIDFRECIKDTVEDELADACIRLLDLAGYRGIDLTETEEMIDIALSEEYPDCNLSFTDWIYSITECAFGKHSDDLDRVVNDMFVELFCFAKLILNIDIEWHINQKMKYNEPRPVKHGKQY